MINSGLTPAQVQARRARGQTNVAGASSSRTVRSIVRANVLTRFNAIIDVLLIIVLVFGPIQDALFGLVIVVNSAVGVIQELRAKHKLDALALLERSPVRVRRDSETTPVAPSDVVLDDIVLLSSGEKVPVDGIVTESAGLELDESLLTGEADPVAKSARDEVLRRAERRDRPHHRHRRSRGHHNDPTREIERTLATPGTPTVRRPAARFAALSAHHAKREEPIALIAVYHVRRPARVDPTRHSGGMALQGLNETEVAGRVGGLCWFDTRARRHGPTFIWDAQAGPAPLLPCRRWRWARRS